jgi:hypothetical protein
MITRKLKYALVLLISLLANSSPVNAQDGTDLYGNNIYEETDVYNQNNSNYSISDAPNAPQTNNECDCDTPPSAPLPPSDPCAAECGFPTVPIDGGASILLLLGGMFGAKKAYDFSKKEKEE